MLTKRKRIIVMLILFMLFGCLCLSPVSSATFLKPQVEVGDYWNYEGNYYGIPITSTTSITGRTNITVNNETYDVLVEFTTIDGEVEGIAALHFNFTTYVCVSDYAVVKTVEHYNSSAINQTTLLHYESICSPPTDIMQYPIEVGETWQSQYNVTKIDLGTMNISESFKTECVECERDDTESAAGKEFYCYVVKTSESEEGQGISTRMWISPSVGLEPVKTETYQNDQLIISLRLLSYNIAHPVEPENGGGGTPGFELVLAVCAIAMILLLRRKRTH